MKKAVNETTVDLTKVYFHGSSEARMSKIDAPSVRHPFYVTPDIDYAMAFCTKSSSNTGDWGADVQKKYTPASSNFVYVITLKPNANLFDFRDNKSSEFKDLAKSIPQRIIDYVFESEEKHTSDIYVFTVDLYTSVVIPVVRSETYSRYEKFFQKDIHSVVPSDMLKRMKPMSEELFEEAKSFCEKSNFSDQMDPHEVMAPILMGLKKAGYQGMITTEEDFNEDNDDNLLVTTDYAIGIFDKSALDMLSLVPMRYTWLKKFIPIVDAKLRNAYDIQTSRDIIARYIQLYKKLSKQK